MNEFFEPRLPPPAEAEERYRRAPWLAAPRGALPGVVALERVLARTDRAAVCVTRVGAFPTGFELDLVTLTPVDRADLDPLLFGPHHHRRMGRSEDVPPDMLRFGLQFADGGKATNVGGFLPPEPGTAPTGPVIVPGGGSGGDGRWQQSFWVWPLPPQGPLLLVCEWPAAGIALTRSEIDAGVILDAAARAQVLFSDEHLPDPPVATRPPPMPHTR